MMQSDFVPRHDDWIIPGKFFFDPFKSYLWWSSWESYGQGNGRYRFIGAYVFDIDPTIHIDKSTADSEPVVVLSCLQDSRCFHEYRIVHKEDSIARQHLQQLASKPDGAELVDHHHEVQIIDNGNSSDIDRFSRAFRHLIKLIHSSPQPKDPNDPFAQ
jgi:hypothetical protein